MFLPWIVVVCFFNLQRFTQEFFVLFLQIATNMANLRVSSIIESNNVPNARDYLSFNFVQNTFKKVICY